MPSWLTWICAHWAELAWGAFALLSALVAAYKTQEVKIHAYVKSTETKADDKLVVILDTIVGVFGVLRLFVPTLIGRQAPTPEKPDGEEA